MTKGGKNSIKSGLQKKGTKLPWQRKSGWRNVTPGSESLSLLVGNEEGGFFSLEEFDGDDFENFDVNGELIEQAEAPEVPEAAIQVEESSRKRKKSKATESQATADADHGSAEVEAVVLQGKIPKERKPKKKRKLKERKDKSVVVTDAGSPDVAVRSDTEGENTVSEVTDEETTAEPRLKKKRKARIGSKARRAKKRDQESATQVSGATVVSSEREDTIDTCSLAKSPSVQEEDLSEPVGVVPKAVKDAKVSKKRKMVKEVEDPDTDCDETASAAADEPIDEDFDTSAWAQMRLHPLLEKAIKNLKFKEPTPIQQECIPAAAHRGKDVIGAAETGSGKTLAFGLPILQRLLEEKDKAEHSLAPSEDDAETTTKKNRSVGPLRALIVSPTRELALQICDHLKAAAKWTDINIVPIVGGMATPKQQRLLSYKPEIVVGTPGRLWELMSNGESHLLELHSLSFFVLDEADRMVEKGHFKELQSIIDALPSTQSKSAEEEEYSNVEGVDGVGADVDIPKTRKRRQTLVFSATLALPPNFKNKLKISNQGSKPFMKSLDSVAALSERAGVSYKAAIVDLTSTSIVAKTLTECLVECREEDKDLYMYYLLKIHGGGRTIVFCTSISALRRISAILKILQLPVHPLHAQMQQKQRLKAMDRFRSSQDCILVATDVAARGLDVPGIRTVIHYQLPHSAEIYVHRSGRTARASTDGCSIALVSPSDKAKYATLCRALSRPDGFNNFPVNMAYVPACKKRVDLAVKVDKLMRKNAQSKAAHAWLARSAEEMELDMQESEDEDEPRGRGSSLTKGESAQLKAVQKELNEMLSQPVKPKAFSNRYITGAGMTPFVTKQLQEYALAMSKSGSGAKGAAGKATSKSKLVVIGQERMDPLEVMRLSAAETTVKPRGKPGKRR
ncbi:ATP-dependent RNA helicase DDX24/MAK5 [Marchantia polymorpha subsp. ruderalis]|nr:hypothetical protein MARPO_0133s0003 [Marchantia polymorpha]BBN10477.1 hypothetical protein Mp_5g03860 [Marchantia polymorpha subsp. ruderalis]|eukprot:PTQ29847.1 hypothetical protein MARPO_0133s0003 [Marchantia polymorpha]